MYEFCIFKTCLHDKAVLQDLSTQQKCLHTQASRLPVDILLSISELSWNLSQFIRDLICNARHDLYGDPWATVVCYLDFDCSSYGIPWIFLSGCVISGHFKMLTDLYTICEKERKEKKKSFAISMLNSVILMIILIAHHFIVLSEPHWALVQYI